MCIAPDTTTILWRTRTSSIQAARNYHLLSQWQNMFYGNHMTPAIPKIVFVNKTGPFLTGDPTKSSTSIILHLVPILWVWLAIACATYDELMKMIVLPPHHDLEHLMQMKERHLA